MDPTGAGMTADGDLQSMQRWNGSGKRWWIYSLPSALATPCHSSLQLVWKEVAPWKIWISLPLHPVSFDKTVCIKVSSTAVFQQSPLIHCNFVCMWFHSSKMDIENPAFFDAPQVKTLHLPSLAGHPWPGWLPGFPRRAPRAPSGAGLRSRPAARENIFFPRWEMVDLSKTFQN